jgi:hypothetical protein
MDRWGTLGHKAPACTGQQRTILSKSREQVPHLFSGRGVTDPNTGAVIGPVYICDECVARCAAALAQDRDLGH